MQSSGGGCEWTFCSAIDLELGAQRTLQSSWGIVLILSIDVRVFNVVFGTTKSNYFKNIFSEVGAVGFDHTSLDYLYPVRPILNYQTNSRNSFGTFMFYRYCHY